MSSSLKQAIEALRTRIADAYTAIANKGGILPATQDSANLPAAIESISPGLAIHFPSSDFFKRVVILGDGHYRIPSIQITSSIWAYGDTLSFDSLTTLYAYNAALSVYVDGLKKVLFPVLKENISIGYGFFFESSHKIEYIYIGANGRGNNLKYLFWGNRDRSSVKDVEFGQGFGHTIDIHDTLNSSPITRETIVSHMLNRLYDFYADPLPGFTPTLYLGTWLNKLTTDDIAIATNKGWTLA